MDTEYLVMLAILQLHRGKSIKLVDGILLDVAGINDISIEDVFYYIIEKCTINMGIKDLNDNISQLMSKGFLSIRDGRLCPSLGIIHYFVEILQYTDDINESLQMLSRRMDNMENK